jgi:hypothetical protein
VPTLPGHTSHAHPTPASLPSAHVQTGTSLASTLQVSFKAARTYDLESGETAEIVQQLAALGVKRLEATAPRPRPPRIGIMMHPHAGRNLRVRRHPRYTVFSASSCESSTKVDWSPPRCSARAGYIALPPSPFR